MLLQFQFLLNNNTCLVMLLLVQRSLFFIIVVQVQLPVLLPQSTPNSLSVPVSPIFLFLHVPLPLLSLVITLPLPSGYCQFVLYFNVPSYILLACLS